MDFDLPPDDDSRRSAVRKWLLAHPDPTGEDLARAGYVVPHWPKPYGLDADPIHQLIIDDELQRAGIRRPTNPTGIGWAGPTILRFGSDEQREQYLWPALAGSEIWCQLFSEPDAGSDLASLGTRAVRRGDHYTVNGSKIWTSGAHKAKYGILLARTDPDAPKHHGISYFICPMDLPGIERRPIVDMTSAHSFNEVFFDDVEIPVTMRVGEENGGWRIAKATLANERVSLSGNGALWGMGPSAYDLLDLVRRSGGIASPMLRQDAARVYSEARVLDFIRYRTLTAVLHRRSPGPEGSIRKVMSDRHGVRVMTLAKDVVGPAGMLVGSGPPGDLPQTTHNAPTEVRFKRDQFPDVEPIWHYGFLFGPAQTIGGGTTEIQMNVIAERVLGLPTDVGEERGMPWSTLRRARADRVAATAPHPGSS